MSSKTHNKDSKADDKKRTKVVSVYPGVWISFSRHTPNWRVVKKLNSPSKKTTGPIYRNCQ
jgi:hypothetical protein